jgi:lysophospholipase L1-like esterase
MNLFEGRVDNWKSDSIHGIRIIAYGSSNTEMHWHCEGEFNWVAWLNLCFREHIGKHVVIINQGIGGDTVKGLLNRFDRDIIPLNPNAVIITIGGNDANRGISIEEYRSDLQTLITKTQKIGSVPILQTYYCPLYHKMGKEFQEFPKFVKINRELAVENKIPIIDQYHYFEPFYRNNPKNYGKIMRDGLHVNPIGNLFMGRIACHFFGLSGPPIPISSMKTILLWTLFKKYQNGGPIGFPD